MVLEMACPSADTGEDTIVADSAAVGKDEDSLGRSEVDAAAEEGN